MTERIGQQLGNYRLIRLLGKGGFADTYLGEHTYLKTQAAIKVLQAQLAQADQEAFFNEARTIARLKHPNIVRVLDFGVEYVTPYLVMDYAPNGTLRQRHPRGVPLPLPVILPYVKQIAAALQYAHSQKLVHRDVKPENMLLGAGYEVLLSDFGIATIVQSTRADNLQNVAGTVSYMAPEQIQGKPREASDQYALAVVVYEWLTGSVPFNGTYVEVALQHERMSPPLLRERMPTISPDVEQVVLTALSKDPQQRFGNIQAFANALEQASYQGRLSGVHDQSASLPAVSPPAVSPPVVSPPAVSPDDSQLHVPTQIASYSIPPVTPIEPAVQTSYGMDPQILRAAFTDPSNPYPPQTSPSGSHLSYTPPPSTPSGIQNPYMPQHTPSSSQTPYLPPQADMRSATPPSYTPPPTPVGVPNLYISQHVPAIQPGAQQPGLQPPISPSGPLSPIMKIALIMVAVLLIAGSGVVYYAAVYHPGQIHAQETATVVAKIAGTASANATGTAQANATAQAQTNATATAVAQATAQVVATQTALQNLYTQATGGAPALNDPLSKPDNYGWTNTQYTDSNGNYTGKCAFIAGAYHAGAAAGYTTQCLASATNFNNLVVQVQITIQSGHSAGLNMRNDPATGSGYFFRVSTDGTYIFEKIAISSNGNAQHTTLLSGESSAITGGNNQSNLLTIIARGQDFYLYINKQYLGSASDGTYSSGEIGVFSDSDASAVEAYFQNMQVWRL